MTQQNNRILLLVEDNRLQYISLRSELEGTGWQIIHCEDMPSTLYAYDQSEKTGEYIDVVAMDLGLPPGKNDPLRTGLKLAKALRQRDADLPILAYTSLSPPGNNLFQTLVSELLPLQISFVSLRNDDPNIVQLLDLAYQDYVFLSPGPAGILPLALPTAPDPLSADLWQTLALLAQGKNYAEIARDLPNIGIDGVRARMTRIRSLLMELGELEDYQRDREDLIIWYRRHHIRYRR
ncbi:MAG: hypothetical protein GY796_08915 [Chloroflexi bacterium]|nr:hypothetical protein [Chloroflexota bacterium]